jgi:hypothetical protein
MHARSDSVPDKIAYNPKFMGFDEALYGIGNVADAVARAGVADGVIKGIAGYIEEGLVFFCDGGNSNGSGVVTDHTPVTHNNIEGNEVAGGNGALKATDSVNNFLVD